MKPIYDVIKVDKQRRIAIPKKLREKLNIKKGTHLSINIKHNSFELRKVYPICELCGNEEELITFKGKKVCKQCREYLMKF